MLCLAEPPAEPSDSSLLPSVGQAAGDLQTGQAGTSSGETHGGGGASSSEESIPPSWEGAPGASTGGDEADSEEEEEKDESELWSTTGLKMCIRLIPTRVVMLPQHGTCNWPGSWP